MTLGMLYLTETVYNQIIAHAREGKPQEVCGILSGRGNRALDLLRGHNIAPNPIKDYVLDPRTLLRQFDLEEQGDEMVAIYHSHPVSTAYPSASDAWSAYYPEAAYIICSLEDDESPAVRAFRMLAHDVTLDLEYLSADLVFDETRPGRFAYYQAEDVSMPSVLRNTCAGIPTPFYVVFESSDESGKDFISRVVSIVENEIETIPD